MPEIFERMRGLYTPVTDIRRRIFAALAKFTIEQRSLQELEKLPFQIVDMRKATYRCCSYRELSIVRQRLRLAMGLPLIEEADNEPVTKGIELAFTQEKILTMPLVHVIRAACERCPEDVVVVTNMCQRCLAHPCAIVCPKSAVTIGETQAAIDPAKCVKCMKCVQACPYQAITRMRRPCAQACGVDAISTDPDGYAAIDRERCVSCGLCTVSCPFGAIADKSEIVQVLLTLQRPENKGKTFAIVAPSFVGQFGRLVTPEMVFEGLRQAGFNRVMEVAFGADCDTLQLARKLAELCTGSSSPLVNPADTGIGSNIGTSIPQKCIDSEFRFLGTSCCPSWVLTARKFFPEMASNIAESYTPMVETAKKIKEGMPDAKVVFIGPCIAKKMEAMTEPTTRWVDHVLTFEEIAAILVAKQIDLTRIVPQLTIADATSLGRGYAIAGGVGNAILSVTREQHHVTEVPFLRADTLAKCRQMLADIKKSPTTPKLVEGMACPGGCVGGPGTLIGLQQAAREVQKFAESAKNRDRNSES